MAATMMSINAVKAVKIGAALASVTQHGSEHGDELTPEGFATNHAGGILGGISTGQDIVVTIGIKPTSSIRIPRRSIDKSGKAAMVETNGRHDPCVGTRVTPITEAMMVLVLMDHALLHCAQNADVRTATPKIPGSVKRAIASREKQAASKINPDPTEAQQVSFPFSFFFRRRKGCEVFALYSDACPSRIRISIVCRVATRSV
jgi:chorismate synthase